MRIRKLPTSLYVRKVRENAAPSVKEISSREQVRGIHRRFRWEMRYACVPQCGNRTQRKQSIPQDREIGFLPRITDGENIKKLYFLDSQRRDRCFEGLGNLTQPKVDQSSEYVRYLAHHNRQAVDKKIVIAPALYYRYFDCSFAVFAQCEVRGYDNYFVNSDRINPRMILFWERRVFF